MRFEVEIEEAVVFDDTIDPAQDEDDRRWFDHEISLARYAEQTEPIRVVFRAVARHPDASELLAGFGQPLLKRSKKIPRAELTGDARNVVLILVDGLRRDALGCYGGTEVETPHLDALAEEAFVYDRAHTPATWVWPAMASVLTGMVPAQHGVQDYEHCFLSDLIGTVD